MAGGEGAAAPRLGEYDGYGLEVEADRVRSWPDGCGGGAGCCDAVASLSSLAQYVSRRLTSSPGTRLHDLSVSLMTRVKRATWALSSGFQSSPVSRFLRTLLAVVTNMRMISSIWRLSLSFLWKLGWA